MPDKTLGEILHEAREAGGQQRPRPWPPLPWAERDPALKALDEQMAAAVEAAVLERFNAVLPEGAHRPVTPELLTALGALWEKFWNEVGTLEGDTPGYSLMSYEDVNTLDEAAAAVEALLYPASPDEGGSEEGGSGA